VIYVPTIESNAKHRVTAQRHYDKSRTSAGVLARLLYADFAPAVSRIIAQPFHLTAVVDGAVRRHIPDYLLKTASGLTVVDVKPAHRVAVPEVAFTFAWTRIVVESRGWEYQVWSEPPAAELENIRFLAGYRRHWLFDPEVLRALEEAGLDGATVGQACAAVAEFAPDSVRAGLLHLLWSGRLTTALDHPLSDEHVLRRAR
jgi:hypothetical protein